MNVLYSAAPMENAKQYLIPVESSSVSAATIDFGGSKVRFGSVHPFSPRPRNQGLWNRSLDSLAQLQHYDNLYVLMGGTMRASDTCSAAVFWIPASRRAKACT